MKNASFLSFDGTSLFSHCCTYHNEASKKVCLIPVVHLGDLEYYQNLENFIGNRQTIFENVKFTNKGTIDQPLIELKNFDDYMEQIAPSTEDFYSKYKNLLNNFYKKFLSKDIKKLLKSVKKQVEKSDNKIQKIYDMSEKTRFNIQSLPSIQLYWAEVMNLTHQYAAIDYDNDIINRKNWIHADLDVGKLLEDFDLDELLKVILTEPSKVQLNEILNDSTITSSDYNSVRLLMSGEIDTFMGFKWKVIGSGRAEGALATNCYAFHKQAIGHAVGIDMKTRVDWVAHKASWLSLGMWKAGSVAIDVEGIVEVKYLDS